MLNYIKCFAILSLFILLNACSSLKENNKQISKYFVAKEALHSSTAKKYKIKNTPSFSATRNIYYAAKRMDEVRRHLNTPIYITSWYRNSKVNKKVGGVKTSDHVDGLAIDFKTKKNPNYIYKKLVKSRLSYDQLIYYPKQKRFHIGFKENKKKERRQSFKLY